MTQLLGNIEGVVCFMDDIVVYGPSLEEHNERVRQVLKKIQEEGMTLNPEKCQFGVETVKFLGHTLSSEGLFIDEEKLDAITKKEAPRSTKELKSFLGMVNYLGKFIPNLADKLQPLNSLLSTKNEWVWDEPQKKSFNLLKQELVSRPNLALFDPSRTTIVSADASSFGIGGVLRQEQPDGSLKPIAYVSRTLSETEKRYSQIEKEGLAIVWTCERLKDYVTGIKIHIETDHKPLIAIFTSKSLEDMTPRLQRLKMRMMRYSYQISHIAGKKQIVADMLSRKPMSKPHKDELEEELSAYIQSIEFPATEERLLEISRKQKEDSLCSQLAKYCMSGWPKNKREVDPELRGYWQFQEDLTYQNGLLLRGQRILIPKTLRKDILEKLHQGHFGINKCRSRAKESVWWLGISQEIERMISSCTKCLKERKPKHEPLMPSEFPIRPWQKVGMDLFYLNGRWYLIVCDYYSRYPEISLLQNLTAQEVIGRLKSIFDRHGTPETVRSDNGPQFQKVLGSEFSKFSKEWSFKHITSSPKFPQSNGFIEAIIKNIKQSFKKEEDCYLTLQAYRTMPLESGYSPAELLMGRRLRTSVPAIEPSLMPRYLDSEALQEREKRRVINQKRLYDKRHDVHSLPPLQQGDSVWVRDQRVKGKVLHKSEEPRSYWVQTPQGKVRRNRLHLTPLPKMGSTMDASEDDQEQETEEDCPTPTASSTRDGRMQRDNQDQDPEKSLPSMPAVHTRYGRAVKIPRRTDNGTEFINKNLETFIESKGIKHELTTPYTPRSNGRVERANRTLLDKGRTLLSDSQLPLHFWAEAVNTAAYLYNLTPTTNDPDTTPMEKWKGKKPSVSHIMRFGCEVFYKLENHQRHKLEAKSKRGIFVGYSRCRRAYRVFDITARVILETADIHFRENNNVISEEKQSDNNTDTDTYFFIQEDEQLDNHVLSDVDIEEPAPDTMINRQTESSESDRPQRTRTIPKIFDDYVLATTNETISKDYDEAIAYEDKKHWENTMLEEIQNMYSHQVWELIPRPVNAKVVKSKWVFKISKDQENKTYKARLVAMGYNQIPGRDYNESFSPVIKNATLRTVLSMAATKDSVIKLFDVKAAYLNGNIENTIFMEQPAGFVQDRNKVCKLNKSIYGLPQSGRSWYEKFSQVLHDCGLEKLKSDPCLFKWKNEDKYFYVGIYVDDFITVSDSEDTSNRFINKLRHHLEIKNVTCKGMFLGIMIIQDKEGISLQQSHYVQQILQKYGMKNCKEVPTPGSKEINLDNHIEDDNCDQHTYQEALGMLMFLAVNTRPDIAYITSKLSQYSRQPKQMHWTAIKRVMRYLRGTIDLGVKFERGKTGILKSYTDASWSTTHDGKSYGGYVLKLGEATIDWKSSKQPLVALSTMEAEMIAACESCCQIKWIINLLRELEEWNLMEKPTGIYTDSQSLINWISSPKQSSRCRHINRKYHFLRDCYESRDICLLYKPSQDLEADIFTKDLSRDQMKKHLESLSILTVSVLRTCTRTCTYVFPRDAAERDLACTETFDFSTPNEWPKWRKRFERYLVVSGMKKKEEADKIDLFMYLMGDRADDIFRTFKFEKEEEATKIDSVLKAFDSHFCVRKNIIYERAKFNSRIQEDREPVDEFITSLYKLADSCEFEGLHEQLIRDRIVVGVRDKALSERMQLDSELTLEKAVNMVRQQEAVRQQQVDLQRPSTSQKVNQVKFNSKNFSPKQQQQPSRKKEKSAKTRSRCPKCGGFTHREGQACRAEGQRCNLCSKTGHFANCCPDKQAKTAEVKAVSELDEEIGFLLEVSATEDSSNLDDDEGECRRRWTAGIQVNGKQVKFKLDSQADVTCVPLCLFKKIMGQQRIVESDINIRAAEFSELQTVGMFISTLRNGNYEIKEKIYVIRRLSEPLLSRRACELLNLARRIEVGATRINPIKEFSEVFEGLGQIGNPYEIKLKPGAKPYAVHTPRRVPIPLMEKLKTRLDIPGKELLDVDALSRQPLLTTEGGEDERPTSAHINAVLSSITDKDEMLTEIFEDQQEDTTLKAVVNYLEQGWPNKKKMSQALLSYWHVKDELGVQNGLLMRSCRLIIPASMKLEILDKLHAGHFGIIKTRLRARETVWWPGISEEIAETVRKCSVCIQEAVSKHEPLIPTNFPTRPWQKIGMDLFKFENKWYLVVIDYYSRFPEMVQLDRLTASVVVRSCKSIFARHGIPETVVSDNGTQFGAAREFANFARQYGFQHVTSSPRFPQSNGMAEAGVKIAKLILKKNQDSSLGLLEYRSTTLENGYSPAELLMGRKLRTTLPIAPENLNPRLVDSQTLKRKEGRRRKDMKSRYDRRCGATDMEELSEGDTVWITDMQIWGIVKQKASTPRSYMVDTPVGTLRRNRFHLRKGVTVQYPADPSTPTFSGEELVENEKTPVVDYPSNDSEDGQIRTRSGRIVKPQTVLRRCKKTSTYVSPRDAAERDLGCTETFDFSTPNEWPKWRKRFERYLVVSGMKKKEEADKIDLFMYLMGDRADDIFRTFKFEKEEEATKIDSVLKAFDSHFCVRKNIIYERAKFNSRIQEDREPVDEFITSLYKLADSCEFEGLHEQLIRDRIVVGVRDQALSERMQLDSELTLEKAVKMVRQQEAVRQQQVDLQRPSTSQKVNQVKFNSKKQSPKQQQQPSRKKEKSAKTRSRCPKCGGFTHREGQACRAEGQKCNLCSKTGHFANCCPDKQEKTAEVKAVSELDEEIGFLLEVSAVEDSSNLDDDEGECRRRWTAEIQVNGKQLKFKLDSQADVTCVPLCLFKKIMGQQRLVKSDINLRAAEFSELRTVGMFISTLRNGNYEIKEKIYVIRRLSEPLLSRRACELLNLARRIEVVATRINPIKEFPEVFEGLGQIGNPYEIKLKPGAKPYAVHTPRRVPIPLMEKLKTRLEELEKAGIIAQVNVATEWCAPTVIAGKPNGDIRLCVDLSRLNEHVQREVHPMPVVEHMLGQLGEARFFSKLDANSGFHQIPLSPDCQHLTTFITPFGRYKYCRMPFGISLAPEYFQRVMSIILQGMDGVMCYLDDILIFASDSKTHDRILRLVLRKLKEAKVTLNKAKCVFGVPRINFLGHILDEDGIRPDPAKIEAVAKMPAPTDVQGVRRFLGMVNHLGRKLRTTLPIAPENLNPKLVDSQTLKRKEGRRRKDMKSRYDRRCGATDMEELSEGDTVWITDMRIWGIVKKKASTPRSYMVDTPVGTLRRNRFHLRKGVAVQYPADPSTPTFSEEDLAENEKTPVVDHPSNDSEDGQIRTR
ncbi:K02A2.6-like, partial [Cordylochernes scorpioides]